MVLHGGFFRGLVGVAGAAKGRFAAPPIVVNRFGQLLQHVLVGALLRASPLELLGVLAHVELEMMKRFGRQYD
jgi:hypothetical protein